MLFRQAELWNLRRLIAKLFECTIGAARRAADRAAVATLRASNVELVRGPGRARPSTPRLVARCSMQRPTELRIWLAPRGTVY
jgi:hypothetical protein